MVRLMHTDVTITAMARALGMAFKAAFLVELKDIMGNAVGMQKSMLLPDADRQFEGLIRSVGL